MANDRDDYFTGSDRYDPDRGRNSGSGRDYTYSSARQYATSGQYGGREDRNYRGGGTGYGDRNRDDRPDNAGGREAYGAGNRDYYGGREHNDRGQDHASGNYGQQRFGGGDDRGGGYGSPRGDYPGQRGGGYDRGGNRDYGRQPQGYDYQDRGFMARAGDEVRSWFGDEDAERRREYDQRYDERHDGDRHGGERSYGARGGSSNAYGRDDDYHGWRRAQIDALDRDYHEYRQENAKKFETEFGTWRTGRQTQRDALTKVTEHMEVVGSDGAHVGTVDKVRGDRIILTKNDADAGGRHHSFPSNWIQSVDDKVTIGKAADDAKKHWRDEERSGAMFGETGDRDDGKDRGGTNLNRSFSGTY